jgi:N-acyl amino acid synthase of PEP-CTERM/exosortase system
VEGRVVVDSNDRNFRFIQVESEDLKTAIYRLRYQVYVEEFGFERPEDHPNHLETDQYDPHSIYVAAVNRADEVIGSARLVLHSEHGFPIEHAVTHLQYPGEKPAPERTAEVSRLTVARAYRRRAEDGQHGVESYIKAGEGGILPDRGAVPVEQERRQRPEIILGLAGLLWYSSKPLGLKHLYMISEKKLWHALCRFGLLFRQIGEPVEYHGIRIPYMASLAECEYHLRYTNPSLYERFLSGLEPQYHPKVSV